jgi:xanthine dehydrogenase YagS FAD-binding subunit
MRPFDYIRPSGRGEAIAAVVANRDGAFLGGGTNIVDLMKLGVVSPNLLVDVSQLVSAEIEQLAEGGVRIGAAVRNSDLAANPVIRRDYPVLSQALLAGASGQLRNMATVGGNLLQRTRCGYFTDPTKLCNKRVPGSGCSARTGHHRELAILGASPACLAVHASDMAVALVALDAIVHVEGQQGARAIPLASFYRLPEDKPDRDTVLEHGELITAVDVPPTPIAVRSCYRKVRDRASFAFALVSMAAAIEVADSAITDARIAFGGVAPVPWRARQAESMLHGASPREDVFRDAAMAEFAAAQPLPANAFKVRLAKNLMVSTLLQLVEADNR